MWGVGKVAHEVGVALRGGGDNGVFEFGARFPNGRIHVRGKFHAEALLLFAQGCQSVLCVHQGRSNVDGFASFAGVDEDAFGHPALAAGGDVAVLFLVLVWFERCWLGGLLCLSLLFRHFVN